MYKTNVEDVGKGFIWASTSNVGGKERAWVELKEEQTIKTMIAEITKLKKQLKVMDRIGKEFLNKMGVRTTRGTTQNMYRILDNSKVLFPNREYVGLEFLGEYISKIARIHDIHEIIEDEIPDDILNGCYKVIDGKIVLDKEKYESEVIL